MNSLLKKLFRPILLMLLIGSLAACSAPESKHTQVAHDAHDIHDTDDAHARHESVDAAKATDQSLYQLESDWQTQTGKTIRLGQLGGKPQVLAMVYASCKNACPRIIADMKRIQADDSKKHPQGARYVLVSIDPEVDTPERLAELARKSKLDEQWLLLRGDSDEVIELAALLGVKYRKISEKDYAHTNLITVLNAKGEVVHRQQGLGLDPAQTLKALDALHAPN